MHVKRKAHEHGTACHTSQERQAGRQARGQQRTWDAIEVGERQAKNDKDERLKENRAQRSQQIWHHEPACACPFQVSPSGGMQDGVHAPEARSSEERACVHRHMGACTSDIHKDS